MAFINLFESGQFLDNVSKHESNTCASKLPKYLTQKYEPNFDYFDNWLKMNRVHQNKAINICKSTDKGQVCIPTGTGKTRIQIALHVSKMIEFTEDGKCGVFVIGSHRLALCSQLLSELITVSVNSGIMFDILYIGSERYTEDKIHCEFKHKGFNSYVNNAMSTTCKEEIKKAVDNAKAKNRHVICVSTYHSWNKLDVLDDITIATYDEAHTLTETNFLNNVSLVLPKINTNLFFTATRKVCGEIGGMNDENIFGDVLVEISPREMIDKGETVPPKLHIIRTIDDGDYNNHDMLVKTVITGYTQHKYFVNKHVNDNFNNVKIGSKLLITTTGNKELFELHDDIIFKKYCIDNNIKVFAFSSQNGVFFNFNPINRSEALKLMNELGDTEDSIMLHIDILTEGIDVPAVTGVMPFRELNKVKLLQTIGRGSRLLKSDRISLYSGSISPLDFNSMIKPCVWIILPEYFKSLGNYDIMKNTIESIVNTYDIPLEEYNTIDKFLSTSIEDLERITEMDTVTRKDEVSGLTHIVEDIMEKHFDTFNKIKKSAGFDKLNAAFQSLFKKG